MRMRYLKDHITGLSKKVELYEEALRHILLACEVAEQRSCETPDDCIQDVLEALEIIENKCKEALDK